MATKIVGLDLGSHAVKLCEVVSSVRKYELVGFGIESVDHSVPDISEFDAYAAAAKRLLDRRGLAGESIMISMPPGAASSVQLDLPFDQPKKIDAILPFQLEEVIPFDIESVVYDYQILQTREDNTCTVVCAYVRESDIAQLLESLQAVGIDPKRVNFGPLALTNLYEHLLTHHIDDGVALIDIGHTHSEIVIFSGGMPKVLRDVGYGGNDLTERIADAFQISSLDAEQAKHSEAFVTVTNYETDGDRRATLNNVCRSALAPLVSEIQRSVAYFEKEMGQPITTIYLTGGGSKLKGLTNYIETTVGTPCKPFESLNVPFSKVTTDREANEPLIAKALSVSIEPFARLNRNKVNLRQGDYAYTGELGFLRGRIITVALAFVLMIALGAMFAVTKKRVLEAEHSRLLGEVSVLSQEILGSENDNVDFLLTTVAADNEAADRGIPEYSAFRLLAEISTAVDPNIKVDVDSIEIDVERKSLSIRGKTGSTSDVDNIVRALKQNRCFRQTEINRNEKAMDERRRFRITGKLTCS